MSLCCEHSGHWDGNKRGITNHANTNATERVTNIIARPSSIAKYSLNRKLATTIANNPNAQMDVRISTDLDR